MSMVIHATITFKKGCATQKASLSSVKNWVLFINQLVSGEREIGWGEYPHFYLKYDIDAYGFPTGTDDRSAPEVKRLTLLRVVQTKAILFLKLMSERVGSDIERPWIWSFNWFLVVLKIIIQFQIRSMSDPTLSDIDWKNKMAWVWTTLKKLPIVGVFSHPVRLVLII